MAMACAEAASMPVASHVAQETVPQPPVHRGLEPEDLYQAIPTLLDGVDELQHENDILLIANTALEEFGVQSIADFAGWLARQEMLIKRNGAWEESGGRFAAPPTVTQIAKFLRETQLMRQRASGR